MSVEKQILDHLHSGISRQIKMANKNTFDGLLINEFRWEHLQGVRGWVAGRWCSGALGPRPVEPIDFYTQRFLSSAFEVGGRRRNKAEVGTLLAFLYLQLEPPTHCKGLTIILIATSEYPHKQLCADIQIKWLPLCKRDDSMLMTLSFSSCISRLSGSQCCGWQCCRHESSSPIYPSKHSKYLQ